MRERRICLARSIGEATWLIEGLTTEGTALSPARAQSFVRDRFFGFDGLGRVLRRFAAELGAGMLGPVFVHTSLEYVE